MAANCEVFPDNTSNLDELDDLQHTIPWYVANPTLGLLSNHVRIKFPGIILPDDVTIVVNDADPTLYPNTYNIAHGKTIWVNTNPNSSHPNDGYIYLDKDYIEKHKHACGQIINSSESIPAMSSDSMGKTGGLWVRSSSWWTRTRITNNS